MMYDDLKDADMEIKYARELKETDKSIGDMMAKNAADRLSHFMDLHKLFVNEAKSAMAIDEAKEKVQDCLWDATHEHMQEWYDDIEKKIKSY